MSKKYFWLKLKEDFFRDKWIKKLRRVAGGDTYTVIYLKMQLLSLKNEGLIVREDLNLDFHQELALEIDEDEDNVLFTLMFLQNNGLIEEVLDGEFMLKQTVHSIGSEVDSAERVRKFREKKKQLALQCNEQVTICNTEKEKEKEKEKESLKNMVDSEESTERSNINIQFEEWWNIYGKKLQKPKALTSFKKVVKKYTYEQLKKDTETYIGNYTGDPKYKPYPATFLNSYSPDDERFTNNSYNNYNTSQQQQATVYNAPKEEELFNGGDWE